MAKPSGTFLLTRNESDPLATSPTKSFPNIRIAIHTSYFVRLLKGTTRRRAHSVREACIVLKSTILEHDPSSRLADSTPPLGFISVASNPTRCVKVSFEAKCCSIGQGLLQLAPYLLLEAEEILHEEMHKVQVGRIGLRNDCATSEGPRCSVACERGRVT